MGTILGNPLSVGGGGAKNGLNVFVQETQPTEQNGLWIKRAKSEVSKVLIKSDYYLADGEAAQGVGTFKNTVGYTGRSSQNCIAVGKIVYTFGGTYYSVYANGEAFAYDTENDVFTNLPSYTVSGLGGNTDPPYKAVGREAFYLNGVISFFAQVASNAYKVLVKYDIETQTYTYKNFPSGPWTVNIMLSGAKQVGNLAYMIAGTTDTGYAYQGILSSYDIENEVFTQLATITSPTGIQSGVPHFIGLYDGTLYIFYGNKFVGTWDLSNFEYTRDGTRLTTDLTVNAATVGAVQLLNKVYLIGGGTSNVAEAASVIVYDLISKEVTVLSDILPYRMYSVPAASALVDGSAYIIGGSKISDSDYKLNTVIKFAIKTNEFANGTVVCQPSSKNNITEMYSDKLATLDFGIDDVYYQSTTGFSKQSAAIIKNGVATDIGGGGVTPEPGPTPTLEGTWVLNDRLYAPASPFKVSVDYTAIFTDTGNSVWKSMTISNYLGFNKYADETGSYNMYTFETNTWQHVRAGVTKSITFGAGATASNDLITWLAANATKQ